MSEPLFEEPGRIARPGLTRRRTAVRLWLISLGLHPLSTKVRKSLKILPGETCGTCYFCQPLDRDVPVSRTVYKCWFGMGDRVTRGHATDIRKAWPACTDWRAHDDPETTHQEDRP